jgi:hypothetical protein
MRGGLEKTCCGGVPERSPKTANSARTRLSLGPKPVPIAASATREIRRGDGWPQASARVMAQGPHRTRLRGLEGAELAGDGGERRDLPPPPRVGDRGPTAESPAAGPRSMRAAPARSAAARKCLCWGGVGTGRIAQAAHRTEGTARGRVWVGEGEWGTAASGTSAAFPAQCRTHPL